MSLTHDEDTIMLSGLPSPRPGHSPAANSNPFSCNICKRSYTRLDHLARHYRSHTREKPFECEVCGKGFARADLLKRHAGGHHQDNVGRRLKTPAKPAHSRVSRACVACAEAKLRCDGTLPCGRCKNKGLTCEYGRSRSQRSVTSLQYQFGDRSSISSDPVNSLAFQTEVPPQQEEYQSSNVHVAPLAERPESSTMMMDSMITGQWPDESTTGNQSIADVNQLPMTATFDHSHQGAGAAGLGDGGPGSAAIPAGSVFQDDSADRFDDLSLLDFLRHVMTPGPPNGSRQNDSDSWQTQSRDLLDFNIDQPFEIDLNGFVPNVSRPDYIPESSFVRFDGDESLPGKGGYITPGNVIRGSVSLGQQAFVNSIWMWTPALGDRGDAEQVNLSLPSDHSLLEGEGVDAAPVQAQLSLATRDRILAMVLSTCSTTSYPLVVACFPSPELLTKLLNICLVHHVRGDAPWIHPATLNINDEMPEFLAAVIATGATVSVAPEIRKLGFAIQEAVRLATPGKFESDNRNTRKLRLLQAYALHLNISLWSGDRRKMEIAESFALPLVTMMRRAGRFRRHRHAEIVPSHDDDERITESKWHSWVEAESFKRLALHLFLRDTQSSISLLSQPLISFAELSIDIPYSRELWLAKTASEWKALYLGKVRGKEDRPPSIRHCVHDTGAIFHVAHIVDVQMALAAVLSSVWALIWQYRKMKDTLNFSDQGISRNNSLTVNSLQQETMHLLQHLHLNAAEWEGGMEAPARLLRELCLMHLHVSLDDVQLLAGKEGEEEARRAFPLLQAWAESSESRQAIFHAGQVIRAAKEYSTGTLREAAAVAVYHASLAFWAYAVFCKAMAATGGRTGQTSTFLSRPSGDQPGQCVRLDGEEGPELQRFLVLGKGIPCICRWSEGDDVGKSQAVPLTDPVAMMATITDLLREKNGGSDRSSPPLVMNLSKLMSSLGTAAAAVRKR